MRYLRFIRRAIAATLTVLVVVLNLRFYLPSATDYGPDRIGSDVVPQLNFIGAALRDGAGQRMQALFPEGFFFSHVLYGLAWAQVGMRRHAADALHAQARRFTCQRHTRRTATSQDGVPRSDAAIYL